MTVSTKNDYRKQVDRIFKEALQTIRKITYLKSGRGSKFTEKHELTFCDEKPDSSTKYNPALTSSAKVVLAQLYFLRKAFEDTENKSLLEIKMFLDNHLQNITFNNLNAVLNEFKSKSGEQYNRIDFISDVSDKLKKTKTTLSHLINYEHGLMKKRDLFINSAKQTLQTCADILAILDAVIKVEMILPSLPSWRNYIFKDVYLEVGEKDGSIQPLQKLIPKLQEEIKQLSKKVSETLTLLNNLKNPKEETVMNTNETMPLTPPLSVSENRFLLVESFNLAMEQASYLNPDLFELDAHYVYADLLEEHFGERFILGKMWALNFTDDAFPHTIIAHEHLDTIVLFALSLVLQDNEELEVQCKVLGVSLKLNIGNLMQLVEQYIQIYHLEFADTKSIDTMNSLFTTHF